MLQSSRAMNEPGTLLRFVDGRRGPGRKSASAPGGPVLLIHGFLSTRRTLAALEQRLARDGFQVLSLELGGLAGRYNTRDIRTLAAAVGNEVDRFRAREPGMPPLSVIGHSKGGLIAAWWVKWLGGHRAVRTLITLGTPHRGTRIAWAGFPFGWLVPSALQMRPGSAFLRRLHEGPWPSRVRLLSFYSRRDRVVSWRAAMAPADGPEVRSVEVDAGHGSFLVDGRVYATVRNELVN